uniref:igLON family member 5 n=1 Tax=Centroberyx gerrardi TaxID=166262 RepID=UPI003AAED259
MGRGVPRTCWLLLALSLTGILAGDWSVQLPSGPICAVIGSSVVLPCSYDYPQSSRETGGEAQLSAKGGGGGGGVEEQEYNVLSEMWCLGESRCITPRYVFHSAGILPDPSYQNRVEYLGEPGTKNCSLRISELRPSDSGSYVFYLVTSHPTQKMPEQSGVQLLVADSSAVAVSASPCGDITEGVALQLACCSLSANPEVRYSWYKGTSATPGHDGQVWSMSDVKAEDTGSYYCQVQTRDGAQNSTAMAIDVQYPPRNTTVSVSPAGELPEGLPVTLTCSSDANPPVHTYTWYQGPGCLTTPGINFQQNSGAESLATPRTGQRLSIANITMKEYGQFCCVSSNRHGSQNYIVTLTADSARSHSASKGLRVLTVGVIVALLLILMGAVAFIIRRRQRSASSHQSYVLTETNPT